MEANRVPNPGSPEAVDIGCTCPQMDNYYGRGIPNKTGEIMYWQTDDCPLHGSVARGRAAAIGMSNDDIG